MNGGRPRREVTWLEGPCRGGEAQDVLAEPIFGSQQCQALWQLLNILVQLEPQIF